MDQKEKEIIALKRFLELKGINFNSELLKTKCPEPTDLEYDGKEYQITTGDGEYFGEILKVTKKYDITDVPKRMVDRLLTPDSWLTEVIQPILKNKRIRASKDIVLVMSILTFGPPISDVVWNELHQKFANANRDLINVWKEVYCVYPNRLIKL